MRFADQGTGNANTLLFAAREVLCFFFGFVREPDGIEGLVRVSRHLVIRNSANTHRQHNVFEDRVPTIEEELLKHEAKFLVSQAVFFGFGHGRGLVAVNIDIAFARHVKTGKHMHQRRFAAARFAHDRNAIAPPYLQIDVLERVKTDAVADVGF